MPTVMYKFFIIQLPAYYPFVNDPDGDHVGVHLMPCSGGAVYFQVSVFVHF